MTRTVAITGFLACISALWVAPQSAAHPLDPILLELIETQRPARLSLALRAPARGTETVGAGAIELPAFCRPAGPVQERVGGGTRTLEWEADCAGRSLAGQALGLANLSQRPNTLLVRAQLVDGTRVQRVVGAATPVLVLPARETDSAIFWSYGALGFGHVLSGYDHLLFVLGLLLLVHGRRRLLLTVTAFTLGHSVTLAAAVLDAIAVDPDLIEICIAASLVLLAADIVNSATAGGRPGVFARYPSGVAGAFGLLHGLGFAGALEATGIPSGEIPLALVAFNLGIEAGQLLFIGCVLAFAGMLSLGRHTRLPAQWRLLPAYIIGTVAFAWVIERSLSALGLD